MTIYSHSRISCFNQCPLKFKYTYIDRIRTNKTSIEAFMGSRFHEVMEHLYKESKFREVSLSELINLYENNWAKKLGEKEVFSVNKERSFDEIKNVGKNAIENYFNRYKPFKEKTLGIEREIIVDLNGDEKYRLKCIIDRLVETKDNFYEIHDYKTSNHIPEQSIIDTDVQLALYEIAVRKAFANVESVDLVWHYVAFDKELRSRRMLEQLQQLKESIIANIDEIEACADFYPSESTLCNWCEHRTICPLFVHLEKTASLSSDEFLNDSAVKLVDEYANLEIQKKEIEQGVHEIEHKQEILKKAIIRKAEEENCKRLYGTEKQITIKDDIKVNYPKSNEIKRAEFENILKALGFWDEIKTESLNWVGLKNLAKKSNWSDSLPKELKDYIEIEPVKQIHLSEKKE